MKITVVNKLTFLMSGVCCALIVAATTGCGNGYAESGSPHDRTTGDPNAPTYTNKNAATRKGEYVGHLKPVRGTNQSGPAESTSVESQASNGGEPVDVAVHFPVVWVVDGRHVERRDDQIPVRKFRLDFDESQPISYDTLPSCLMTRDTHEIVIHRGGLQSDFSHDAIHDGEPCLPVYQCWNPSCPWVKKTRLLSLFPYDYSRDGVSPVCPHCKTGGHVRAYKTPQYRDMERFMMREIYRKRRAAKAAEGV